MTMPGRMSTYITKVDSNDIDKVELTYNEHGVATGATFYTDGMLPGAADESAKPAQLRRRLCTGEHCLRGG